MSSPFFLMTSLVQILVLMFLNVNCLMIFTFLKKEMFREETRYILFAQTLFVDTAFILICTLLVIVNLLQCHIPVIPCILICTAATLFTVCTPLTLVAMCLERYVAICMPLNHANISTSRTRFLGLLVIWAISLIPAMFNFIAYVSVVPRSTLLSYTVCSVELMIGEEWQAQTRFMLFLLVFLFMLIIILFTYIKIMIAARGASSEKKKSTNKSLKTVILHAFQLFLCTLQFICPYIEKALWNDDLILFISVRYFDFIAFIIAPRCLSPLIYGLRDDKFFHALRHNAMCGFNRCFSPLFNDWKIRPSSPS
ncbi:odorant receptor 131-2-like [Hoplias malabaricus]|uniref:odorant receptor 131-2-like n=1 Tax=Hoplias malabaricus TaxID=27720 RepID=UPI003463563A